MSKQSKRGSTFQGDDLEVQDLPDSVFAPQFDLWRRAMAEFCATGMFVFIGTGAAVSELGAAVESETTRVLAIALAFGLAITVLVYAAAHVSGGHINPAVTFAFVLLHDLPAMDGIVYIVSQLFGAVVGSACVYGCMGSDHMTSAINKVQLAANNVNLELIDSSNAFFLEMLGTMILVFVVMNVAHDKASIAGPNTPVAVGYTVALVHIVLIPFTGCGINPARSFGPAVVNSFRGINTWEPGCWVYYTAPFVGSCLALMVSANLFVNKKDKPLWRRALAEAFATSFFVFFGTGAAVSGAVSTDVSPYLAIAFGFGFGLLVMIYSVAHISGGLLNPAVTLAFMLLRELPFVEGLVYMAAQLVGGFFGSLFVFLGTGEKTEALQKMMLGANSVNFGEGINQGNAFFIEMIGTLILVFIVINVAHDKASVAGYNAPLGVGYTVLVLHIVMIPFTGCGINPARSFGPALMNSFRGVDSWSEGSWIFYTAPFVGAVCALVTSKIFLGAERKITSAFD